MVQIRGLLTGTLTEFESEFQGVSLMTYIYYPYIIHILSIYYPYIIHTLSIYSDDELVLVILKRHPLQRQARIVEFVNDRVDLGNEKAER